MLSSVFLYLKTIRVGNYNYGNSSPQGQSVLCILAANSGWLLCRMMYRMPDRHRLSIITAQAFRSQGALCNLLQDLLAFRCGLLKKQLTCEVPGGNTSICPMAVKERTHVLNRPQSEQWGRGEWPTDGGGEYLVWSLKLHVFCSICWILLASHLTGALHRELLVASRCHLLV